MSLSHLRAHTCPPSIATTCPSTSLIIGSASSSACNATMRCTITSARMLSLTLSHMHTIPAASSMSSSTRILSDTTTAMAQLPTIRPHTRSRVLLSKSSSLTTITTKRTMSTIRRAREDPASSTIATATKSLTPSQSQTMITMRYTHGRSAPLESGVFPRAATSHRLAPSRSIWRVLRSARPANTLNSARDGVDLLISTTMRPCLTGEIP
mmetsp:Transcript_3921/g.4657  ORF Transcript_3921/g.4657 Transcript_3921/m.4657 type:complete len:210 (+) Transcript_3921:180-809(+)